MTPASFSDADLAQLAAAGISVEDARRQLALLRQPPPPIDLRRPCTVGDGIRRFDTGQLRRLEEMGKAATLAGRVSKLVPASGAATRMFQAPLSWVNRPGLTQDALREFAVDDPSAAQVGQLLDAADTLPFFAELSRELGRNEVEVEVDGVGQWSRPAAVLSTLLRQPGLGYADLPKGLIPFHREARNDPSTKLPNHRTAFEEHLSEATAYSRDADGRCRLHFTVTADHQALFERHSKQASHRFSDRATFEITFSTQPSATDTLALDSHGLVLRHEDGSLVLRPGGHGALLANLEAIGGDLVVVKNIDNVVPQRAQEEIARWKRVLIGLTADLQQRSFEFVAKLDTGQAGVPNEAASFLRSHFGLPITATQSTGDLRARLNRPLRVCGMVANTGEPGGGPYWARSSAFGESAQIVERAQIDTTQAAQADVLDRATHFNPVDLVCAPRDHHGVSHDLSRFVDPETAFVSTKMIGGRTVRVLERPGLWNGAMAGWNTLFVEVPLATFAPVKTVLDLLRPEHQG